MNKKIYLGILLCTGMSFFTGCSGNTIEKVSVKDYLSDYINDTKFSKKEITDKLIGYGFKESEIYDGLTSFEDIDWKGRYLYRGYKSDYFFDEYDIRKNNLSDKDFEKESVINTLMSQNGLSQEDALKIYNVIQDNPITEKQLNALKEIKHRISDYKQSKSEIIENMQRDFSLEDINFALDCSFIDWYDVAKSRAHDYTSRKEYIHSELVKELKSCGFSNAESEYAADMAIKK